MKILPTETLLAGEWQRANHQVVADKTCERINRLVESFLKEIGRDSSGWDVLYRDPGDGRFWELTYPQSELLGGGPPQLRCMTSEQALEKYGITLDSTL
jgi:hypothetical protein